MSPRLLLFGALCSSVAVTLPFATLPAPDPATMSRGGEPLLSAMVWVPEGPLAKRRAALGASTARRPWPEPEPPRLVPMRTLRVPVAAWRRHPPALPSDHRLIWHSAPPLRLPAAASSHPGRADPPRLPAPRVVTAPGPPDTAPRGFILSLSRRDTGPRESPREHDVPSFFEETTEPPITEAMAEVPLAGSLAHLSGALLMVWGLGWRRRRRRAANLT